jgi:hypothetical protein
MARADTRTLLPLDAWARLMGFHPLHFNGVYLNVAGSGAESGITCGQQILQQPWQGANAVSREDIATAIADAEDRIAQYTRFKLLPTFVADERQQWPRSVVPELYVTGLMNVRGQAAAVRTRWAHVVAGGVEARTALALSTPVSYADTDGDGYKETATFSVTTNMTDANELRVFYPGESGHPEWEIRPVKLVSANGVTAAFQCRREQLVTPGHFEAFSNRGVDGADDAQFLASVDVYRVWHDPSQQVQFLWENQPAMCNCGSPGCPTCYLAAQFGCTIVRDYRTGMITASPASWDASGLQYIASTLSVGRAPDRVRLWYRAGYRDQALATPFLTMAPNWARAVAYFATALLARPMCACQNVTSQVEHWATDLAATKSSGGGAFESFRISTRDLDNPFGTTRGAMHAWRTFRNEPVGEAVGL